MCTILRCRHKFHDHCAFSRGYRPLLAVTISVQCIGLLPSVRHFVQRRAINNKRRPAYSQLCAPGPSLPNPTVLTHPYVGSHLVTVRCGQESSQLRTFTLYDKLVGPWNEKGARHITSVGVQTCYLVGHHEDMAEARYSKSPPAYTDDQGGETASTELVQFHFNDHDDKVSRRHMR